MNKPSGLIFDLDGTLYPRESTLYLQISDRTRAFILSQSNMPDPGDSFEQLKQRFPNPIALVRCRGWDLTQYFEAVFGGLDPPGRLGPNEGLLLI